MRPVVAQRPRRDPSSPVCTKTEGRGCGRRRSAAPAYAEKISNGVEVRKDVHILVERRAVADREPLVDLERPLRQLAHVAQVRRRQAARAVQRAARSAAWLKFTPSSIPATTLSWLPRIAASAARRSRSASTTWFGRRAVADQVAEHEHGVEALAAHPARAPPAARRQLPCMSERIRYLIDRPSLDARRSTRARSASSPRSSPAATSIRRSRAGRPAGARDRARTPAASSRNSGRSALCRVHRCARDLENGGFSHTDDAAARDQLAVAPRRSPCRRRWRPPRSASARSRQGGRVSSRRKTASPAASKISRNRGLAASSISASRSTKRDVQPSARSRPTVVLPAPMKPVRKTRTPCSARPHRSGLLRLPLAVSLDRRSPSAPPCASRAQQSRRSRPTRNRTTTTITRRRAHGRSLAASTAHAGAVPGACRPASGSARAAPPAPPPTGASTVPALNGGERIEPAAASRVPRRLPQPPDHQHHRLDRDQDRRPGSSTSARSGDRSPAR